MIKLEANKKLSDQWYILGRSIQLQRNIVQTDMQVSQHQVDDWLEISENLQNEFQSLIDETIGHYDLKGSAK